jgi:hypothetical protein
VETDRANGVKVGVSLVVLAVLVVAGGVGVAAVNAARFADEAATSKKNLELMGKGMHNCAANTPSKGYIPPSYGEFPPESKKKESFFYHLLPYVQEKDLYEKPKDAPVKTYIAPLDKRNAGKDATISYASNALLLGVERHTPRLPNSFYGRTAGVIVVMECSGLDDKHKWNNNKNYLGKNDTAPPFPQIDVDPKKYEDGSPQGFNAQGCQVMLGDGSARFISPKMKPATWKWACSPEDTAPQPSDF